MSTFHSVVSRRDFMKVLGLTGAGFGSAALTAPAFHDLDELISADSQGYKKPWWVKNVEEITTDVDWDRITRFDKQKYNNFASHLTKEEVAAIQEKTKTEKVRNLTQNNVPGFTLRDQAVKVGVYGVARTVSNDPIGYMRSLQEGNPSIATAEMLGVPKWNGTPEDNSAMVRQVLRLFGASTIGFVDVSERNRKLIWLNCGSSPYPKYVFEDAPKPVYDATANKMVIPNASKSAIVYTIRMPLGTFRHPGYLSDGGAFVAYDNCYVVQYRLQAFLKTIGYSCIAQNLQGIGPIAAWGALAGLGEIGRLQHLVTPEWGPMIRESTMNISELPVAPTNPIDFGAQRFCTNACVKCASMCPPAALQLAGEPSWDITGPDPEYPLQKSEIFNNPGIKSWYFNHFRCNKYWNETDTYCGRCTATCVFSKETKASIHEVVKPVISSTPILNKFFTSMDQSFGYGVKDLQTLDEWWDTKLPVHGIHYSADQ